MTAAGRVAWVTGASSGIGRALARHLARDGWTVIASARSADALESLASEAKQSGGGTVVPWPLDVTDAAGARAAVVAIEARHGPIEQAVLVAGTYRPTPAAGFSAEAVQSLIEINLLGSLRTLEPLIEAMRGRQRGRIAIVASMVGYGGLPTAGGYGLTKAGLINLCEALRPELARDGILLQVVNPGFVKTPLTARNDFPMPFLMEVEDAAEALVRGLRSDRFEIAFPLRLHWLLRIMRMLPYRLYFAITRRMLRDPDKGSPS